MSDWNRSLCPNRFSPKNYFFRKHLTIFLLDASGLLPSLTIPPFICEALSEDIITVFSGIFSVIVSLCGVKMVNTEVILHWPFSSLRHLASLHSPLPSLSRLWLLSKSPPRLRGSLSLGLTWHQPISQIFWLYVVKKMIYLKMLSLEDLHVQLTISIDLKLSLLISMMETGQS